MKNTTAATSHSSLVLALGAALAVSATPVLAQDMNKDMAKDMGAMAKEKCYGVALKGKNDCKAGAGTSCAGSSKRDYQGDSWSFVPKGSCEKTPSPTSATGMGQLKGFAEKS
jgi:uncharacterized membrane protein